MKWVCRAYVSDKRLEGLLWSLVVVNLWYQSVYRQVMPIATHNLQQLLIPLHLFSPLMPRGNILFKDCSTALSTWSLKFMTQEFYSEGLILLLSVLCQFPLPVNGINSVQQNFYWALLFFLFDKTNTGCSTHSVIDGSGLSKRSRS